MGLSKLIASVAATAFKVGGDVKKSVVIYAEPAPVHDVATDKSTPNFAKIKPCEAFIYDAEEKRPDPHPERIRQVCFIQGSEVPGIKITEACEVDAIGHRWKTESVSSDPGNATYTLTIYR